MALKRDDEKRLPAWTAAVHASFFGMTEGEVRAALCDYIAREPIAEIARITWLVAQSRAVGAALERDATRWTGETAEALELEAVGLPSGPVLRFPARRPRF